MGYNVFKEIFILSKSDMANMCWDFGWYSGLTTQQGTAFVG